jgi:hypothetical protein
MALHIFCILILINTANRMNTNSLFSNDLLCENYAWVDAMLEKKFYDYHIEEDDDINLNYETFGLIDQRQHEYQEVDQDQDQEDSDFNLLVRDLQALIAYHQDRRQRRNSDLRDFFGTLTTQSISL